MNKFKAAAVVLALLTASSALAQYREHYFTVYTPLHVTWYTCSHLTFTGSSSVGSAKAKCQSFQRDFSTEAIFVADFEKKIPKGYWNYKLHWWDALREREDIITRDDCSALTFSSNSLILSCND